jgi:hypothetical protein
VPCAPVPVVEDILDGDRRQAPTCTTTSTSDLMLASTASHPPLASRSNLTTCSEPYLGRKLKPPFPVVEGRPSMLPRYSPWRFCTAARQAPAWLAVGAPSFSVVSWAVTLRGAFPIDALPLLQHGPIQSPSAPRMWPAPRAPGASFWGPSDGLDLPASLDGLASTASESQALPAKSTPKLRAMAETRKRGRPPPHEWWVSIWLI